MVLTPSDSYGKSYYEGRPPPGYYDGPPEQQQPDKRPDVGCCSCLRREAPQTDVDVAVAFHNGHGSASVLASYGVFAGAQRPHPDVDDDDGFLAGYPRSVVTNADGQTTALRSPMRLDGGGGGRDAERGHALLCGGDGSWCRPTVLLLVLVLLVVVFVLVAGILLCLNYMSLRQRQTSGDIECSMDCPADLAPVCGSDDVTYRNLCLLRRKACIHRDNTRLLHTGQCEHGSVDDPCRTLRCAPGSACVVTTDGDASCRCDASCPLEDADRRLRRPVCGSDGLDYGDVCELKEAACRAPASGLAVRYLGECDPCSAVRCTPPQVCQLDEERRPVCRCGEFCPRELAPVCGSDGKTYSSECALRQQACRSRRSLRIIYRGKCSSGTNPCANLNCRDGQLCHIDKLGVSRCECPGACEPVFRPVCGSDALTYDSACELRREACLAGKVVQVQYEGQCGDDGPCASHRCQHGAICVSRGADVPSCECPTCPPPPESSSVCGSDHATYESECHLHAAACRRAANIELVHHGPCDGCETFRCGHHGKCETDEDGNAHCVCPHCNDESELTVCGSDGTTFRNECELRRASCHLPPDSSPISVNHIGECKNPSVLPNITSTVTITSTTRLTPVHQVTVNIAQQDNCQDIQCDFAATCELDPDGGFPHCVCHFDCSLERLEGKSVCGSDWRTYLSECDMKAESCRRKEELRLRPLALCKGMEVKPCNGESPLINPANGIEFDCGNGPNRQDCPSGTYCHQTTQFARCCRKNLKPTLKSCTDSWFGCCPDGKTPAQGVENAGCPSQCGCNKLGSVSDSCDPETEQCACKPGVGGLKCDRCEPGYWGLHKISEGHSGCFSCGCSPFGSVREDCEQMTGRCMCKPGVQGQKCTVCVGLNKILGPSGCVSDDEGTRTEKPPFHWTTRRYTQPEDEVWSLSKSTRHLLSPASYRYHYFSESQLTSASLHHLNDSDTVNEVYYFGMYQPTPATVTAVIPLLGDLCTVDSDCGVPQSQCVNSACVCRDGFSISSNRQQCLAYQIPAFDGMSYVQLKQLKAYHKLSVEVEFISYAKDGIILYDQQKEDGSGDYVSLAIVDGYIEFRYNLGNGPVALASRERVVLGRTHRVHARRYHRDGLLRFDGGQEVAGQSQGPLRALDLEQDAFIGGIPINEYKIFENIGTSQGFVGCILHLKIGQQQVHLHEENPLVTHCFGIRECGGSPCASLPCQNFGSCVILGTGHFRCDCLPGYTGSYCENRKDPCSSSPCVPGSICESLPLGGFSCRCNPSAVGHSCQDLDSQLEESFVPEFNGDSYLELPRLEGVAHAFYLEIWFLSKSKNGILLYNAQVPVGKGDFIFIALVNGHVQFSYDLGSGASNITSEESIVLGLWHKVKVSRIDRDGTLQLDSGTVATGQSGSPLVELNLELPLYLAGVPSDTELSFGNNVSAVGLDGAVQRVLVNGQILENLGQGVEGISQWLGTPCSNVVCYNGGVCQPLLNSYTCRCPSQYKGIDCQHLSISSYEARNAVKFNGDTFYQISVEIQKSSNISDGYNATYLEKNSQNEDGFIATSIYDDNLNEDQLFDVETENSYLHHYEITFRTLERSCLLLWLDNDNTQVGQFIIVIVEGFVNLNFHIGKHILQQSLQSKMYVSDGAWHTLTAFQSNKHAHLKVDNEKPVIIQLISHYKWFNSNQKIWLGGVSSVPSGLPSEYYMRFRGCIWGIKIGSKHVSLLEEENMARTTTDYCHENDI